MKNKIYLAAACAVIFFSAGISELRAASESQRFQFLGKTGSIIWIARDVYNPSKSSWLHYIIVTDSNATAATATLENFGDWYPARQLIDRLVQEQFTELGIKRDYIGNDALSIRITPSAKNAAMFQSFREHIGRGGSIDSWNSEKGKERIMQPTVEGRQTRLIYFYPGGLYFNYDVERAIWLGDSGCLLIFTRQDIAIREDESLSGFMIFKVGERLPVKK